MEIGLKINCRSFLGGFSHHQIIAFRLHNVKSPQLLKPYNALNSCRPPMTKKNFVVRKSWYGRGQIISFMPKASKTNPKPQLVTYNHDVVFDIMEPFLKHKAAWAKYGYWSQSTNMPTLVRHRDLLTEDDKKFLKPTKAKK